MVCRAVYDERIDVSCSKEIPGTILLDVLFSIF
jgi:hypothetical protein